MDRVFVDFLKRDGQNRVKLTAIGTKRDLERLNIVLSEGMRLGFYCDDDVGEDGNRDDLLAEGTVHFDVTNGIWVAQIDDGSLRHASEGD